MMSTAMKASFDLDNLLVWDNSKVPELRPRCSKRERYTKLHYTNRTAPVKRPFLLTGELASPAAEF